jgi:4-amino-4-deoxy-L-arabinose transferase-like glycosyltransferase
MLPMSPRVALIICLVLAAIFGVTSYSAVRGKGPTIDEPLHFVSAYAHTFLHDDRLDPDNPMLWKRWMMLPLRSTDLSIDQSSPEWREIGMMNPPHGWFVPTLLSRDFAKSERLINRSRLMMTLLAIALCLFAAWWAYQLAGPWAAIATSVLIALDPTFLAHAPILKNDIALSLAMLCAMLFSWRVGRRVTVIDALALAVACAIAINCKFSGFLVPLLVIGLLLSRALLGGPWNTFGRETSSRFSRLAIAASFVLLIGLTCLLITWWSYGFRYAPADDPALAFQTIAGSSTLSDRVMDFALRHHLLPLSYSAGFLRIHASLGGRRTYILESVVNHGVWYYFPFALLVKTPLATILAAAIAPVAIWKLRRQGPRLLEPWAAMCLLVPAAIYLAAAMTSDLNIGIRHILPMLPMMYIAIGVVTARAIAVWPRVTRLIGAALVLGLAIESFAAYPNYVPFFNAAAGGSRGGLKLLGDSNLDWGQDLPLLMQWQAAHPNQKLYVAYFGAINPQWCGLRCTVLPSGFELNATPSLPDSQEPCVFAISGSILQGLYADSAWDAMYAEIRTWKPREVLGGSIYLYDFPPR